MEGWRPGIGCWATIAALLVVLALPASAGAGEDVVTNGTLRYVTETTQIPDTPTPHAEGLGVACPDGTRPISGGFETTVDPSQDAFDITTSQAAEFILDAHGWVVDYFAHVASTRNFTVRAVCAEEVPKAFLNDKRVDAQRRGTISVKCSPRRHVYGGGGGFGLLSNSHASLASSFPIDSGDRNNKPDDGWKVSVDNFASSRRQIYAIAYCGKTMPDYYDSRETVPPAGGMTTGQGCGKLAAIGGGHRISGGFDEGFLTQSIVSNPTTFDVFDASMTNDASHDLTFTAYSICGDPGDFG